MKKMNAIVAVALALGALAGTADEARTKFDRLELEKIKPTKIPKVNANTHRGKKFKTKQQRKQMRAMQRRSG